MIRYRTGDLVSENPEPCVCGRTMTRISRIHGRSDDMLIVRGVNVFPSEIERVLLAHESVGAHYQLVWEGSEARPDLVVEVESANPAQVDMARIREHLKSALSVNLTVRLVDEGVVPRSQGKAVRVVRRL